MQKGISEGLIMTDEAMLDFIKRLSRSEMYDEVKRTGTYTAYLKAICTTLEELGYNRDWIDDKFVYAFIEHYGEKGD